MAKVTVIKELSAPKDGIKWMLVSREEDSGEIGFFVVSSANYGFFNETLVFPASEAGVITSWGDVAGGPGMSREEAIEDLANLEIW